MASLSERIGAQLAGIDAILASRYAGDVPGRQPVHTCYVPADKFAADTPRTWGAAALSSVDEFAGGGAQLAGIVGDQAVASLVERVKAKLASEPVEDVRVDFEDGYGIRASAEEDEHVAAAIGAIRDCDAPFIGIRIKCFESNVRERSLRTLEAIVSGLAPDLPAGFIITLPKVTFAEQVAAMADACDYLESTHGLPAGRLRFEVQVETAQAIMGPDGSATVARMIDAGRGRVSAFHYGTYDYSASVGVSAAFQAMDHPAADFAKQVMQVAAAGTGVRLSDGSTNILPVGDAAAVHRAWALHYSLVRRSLARAYYQGWDLHAHQLVTRHAATMAFYREGFDAGLARLQNYLGRAETGIADEPATAIALARYVLRGIDAGAVDEPELAAKSGLSAAQLRDIVARRGQL